MCERVIDVRSTSSRRDWTGVHPCLRPERWEVTTPDGQVLKLCTQHKKQLVEYWAGRATVEELPAKSDISTARGLAIGAPEGHT